jgi:hypothetical protein
VVPVPEEARRSDRLGGLLALSMVTILALTWL